MNQLSTSERLKHSKHQIVNLWETRARQTIGASAGKDSNTLQDELHQFLEALCMNLTTNRTFVDPKEELSAKTHGQQRAGLLGYTLIQTLKEYSVLREVIIEVLISDGSMTETERNIIHRTIDHAMQLASNEFVEAEQSKIKLALAQAERSNRDLDQFAAVAAHDLRAPLTSIAGFTEIIREEIPPAKSPEVDEAFDLVQAAVKRMARLIEGILEYARLGSESLELVPTDVSEAVRASIQNLKAQLTSTGGRVGFDKLPTVMGNLPLLTQVFQNLISNALKFRSSESPVVDITTILEDSQWLIRVADNGRGFDPKYKDVIFELHKKLHGKGEDGAGIGLATCRRVVELHGGRIWAESSVGKGATFYITLPKL